MKQKTIKKEVFEYVAVFEPDEKVGGYTATIPALPGCISEGDTFEDAFTNIREAAQLYLDVMAKTKRKDFFRKESVDCICPPKQPICTCGHKASIKEITRKPMIASAQEVEKNSRARSAKLRVAEKL